MRCHECNKPFKPSRSDQVFHTKGCRAIWFNRKAKMAMAVVERLSVGDRKGAIAVYQAWQSDADRRIANA